MSGAFCLIVTNSGVRLLVRFTAGHQVSNRLLLSRALSFDGD
jgi:hypothetical protein